MFPTSTATRSKARSRIRDLQGLWVALCWIWAMSFVGGPAVPRLQAAGSVDARTLLHEPDRGILWMWTGTNVSAVPAFPGLPKTPGSRVRIQWDDGASPFADGDFSRSRITSQTGPALPESAVRLRDLLPVRQGTAAWASERLAAIRSRAEGDHLAIDVLVDGQPGVCELHGSSRIAPPPERATLQVTGILLPPESPRHRFRLLVPDASRIQLASSDLSPFFPDPFQSLAAIRSRIGPGRTASLTGMVASVGNRGTFQVDSGGLRVEVASSLDDRVQPGEFLQVVGTWRTSAVASVVGRLDASLYRPIGLTAGNPPTWKPVLRSIASVEGLASEVSDQEIPVSLEATVTGDFTPFGEAVLFLQDETGSIYCYPSTNRFGFDVGERVHVVGRTGSGNFAPEIIADSIRALGTRRSVQSARVQFESLKGGQFDSRWVELNGVVTRVWRTNSLAVMELSDGVETVEVRLGSSGSPLRFLEAIVRVHGVVATRYNESRQAIGAFLWCPSESFLQVEESPPEDPFAMPVRPISLLRGLWKRTPGPSRAHIRGVVTATFQGGRCIVQNGTDAVEVQSSSETPPSLGTEVDVVGLVGWSRDRLEIRRAHLRPLGNSGMPVSVGFSISNALPDLEGVRRTLEGEVLSYSREPGITRLLLMSEVAVEVRVPLFTERMYQMEFSPGARVRVTGATRTRRDSENRITGVEMFAGQPGDVVLLRRAPLWNAGTVTIAVASTSVVLLVAYLWMASLRLKVRQQASEIDARYRAQTELERRNTELVEQAGEMILELSTAGVLLSVNPAAARLFRRPPTELVGHRLAELVSEEHRPAVLEAVEAANRGGAETLQVQTPRGRGTPLWLELRIQRYGTGEQGTILGAVGRDISDRRQAELALQQSEQNLRRIIEFLPDGVILLDRSGSIRFQNRRASQLLGFPQDGLVGRHVGTLRNRALELWIQDLLDSSDAEDAGGRRDGSQTLELARAEGTELLADISVGVVRRSDSRSCLVCFRDAAPRLAAEEALRNQATLARVESGVSKAISLAEEPAALLDQCARLLVSLAGVAVARFWFRAAPAAPLTLLASAADRDFYGDPADLPPPPESWRALLGVPDGFRQVDFLAAEPGLAHASLAGLTIGRVHALAGGDLGEGLLEVYFRRSSNATIAPLLGGIVSSISGGLVRIQAVRSLDHTNSKLRAVLASAPVAILELAPDKRVLDLNPAAETLLRRPASEIRGVRFPDLFGADSPLARHLREVVAGATLDGIETALQHPDGTSTPCSLYAAATQPTAEIVCVLVDLAERRRMEAEAERIQRKLRDAQRLESLGVMAGGIAHDFNNILGAILGNAGLARSRPQADPEIRESLDEIGRAAQRAGELCRLMLAYAGQAGIGKQAADLSEIVRDTLRLVRHGVSKLAEIELDLASPLPPTPVDTAQFRQIVLNLVTNASEALGDRPGRIRIRTAVADPADTSLPHADLPPERHVLLEVSDTGCGMDETVVSRIFDPFFSTKFAGRGLGLAAVWGVVRGHSGQIAVHSVPGQGSTFRVWLPCPHVPVEAAPAPAPQVPVSKGFPSLVLLVDDEAPLRMITRQILKRFGAEVLEAEDGAAGLELILRNRDRRPVVLLDVTMPKMSGREVLERLRTEAPEIQVVLTSGYIESDSPESRPAGAAAFLSKPFTAESLKEVLGRFA